MTLRRLTHRLVLRRGRPRTARRSEVQGGITHKPPKKQRRRAGLPSGVLLFLAFTSRQTVPRKHILPLRFVRVATRVKAEPP